MNESNRYELMAATSGAGAGSKKKFKRKSETAPYVLNAQNVRKELEEAHRMWKNGEIDFKELKEVANILGKISSNGLGQLKYYALRGEKPDIEFYKEDKNLWDPYTDSID